ncbi:MAG: class I SAM-dependent methyltransferase [Saprospiraceae bacterium]
MAEYNTSHIHAFGSKGTDVLLQMMDLPDNAKVLEIGCGTGATLIEVKDKFPLVDLSGMDISEKMIKKAKQRLKCCGLRDQIKVFDSRVFNEIPPNSYDLIYAESVLAIIEGASLSKLLKLIYKTLKKDGLLLVNESLWLKTIATDEIFQLNEKAKNEFGIIQCRSEFQESEQLNNYFKSNNFKITNIKPIDEISVQKRHSFNKTKSGIYTKIGKLNERVNSIFNEDYHYFEQSINAFFSSRKQYLRGNLIFIKKVSA